MKIVGISRVRNETDIIESFIRHHAALFDKLIVLDDGSSDGTYEKLRSLRGEGLPLVVMRSPVIGYEQSRYMTRLLHSAIDQFGADWVVPLDADEFIEVEDREKLQHILAENDRSLSLAWHNFRWDPQCEDDPEPNPVIRLRWRLPPRSDHNKVLVRAASVDDTTGLAQGNHALVCADSVVETLPTRSIRLCHFPIRSVQQYASKMAIGYLQYLALPDWNRGMGFHIFGPFETLLSGGLEALRARMLEDSRRYGALDDLGQRDTVAVEKPLRYLGGSLKLGGANVDCLQNILHFGEAIAKDRANLARRNLVHSADEDFTASVTPLQSTVDRVLNNPSSPDVSPALLREMVRLKDENDILDARLAATEIKLFDAQQELSRMLNSRTFRLATRINKALRAWGIKPDAVLTRLSSWHRRWRSL